MKFSPQRLPYKKYMEIYSTVPRSTVDICIKRRNKILLTKREIEPRKGFWHFPGGTILYGESLSDTIKRVAKEETGLNLKVIKFLGIMEFYPTKKIKEHVISHVFLAKTISGKLSGSKQAREMEFFNVPPKNTVREQKVFWLQNNLTKSIE